MQVPMNLGVPVAHRVGGPSGRYAPQMAYATPLAQRVRESLADVPGPSERAMFGGLAFMSRGRMVCGIVGEDLIVRVGPDRWAAALKRAHAREMDFTGRSMRGFVFVGPLGTSRQSQVDSWLRWAWDFVATLPPKG